MKSILSIISVFNIIIILSTGCSRQNEDIQLSEAIEISGSNRNELEYVLSYYKSDSLKLEAAKFLIRNMPGHYSYADTVRVNRYYNSVDSILNNLAGQSIDNIRDTIDSLAQMWNIDKVPKIMDIQIISSDFLIQNIDEAFRQWREEPWCSHLSFDEFCEYILPYKSVELQPFDSWRTEFKELYSDELEKLRYADLFRNSSFTAATIVRDNMNINYHPTLAKSFQIPILRTSTRLRLMFGLCKDYVVLVNTVFRSMGIPVSMEFTPQWSYQDKGHDWNTVFTRKGLNVPFCGLFSSPSNQAMPYENMPKAYRHTYAQNLELRELNKKEKYVPPLLRNLFLKDVTQNHITTVTLYIDAKKVIDEFAYLAIASGTKWNVVGWGRVLNNSIVFENVGRECIYLPVDYDSDGQQQPISAPIRVKANGEIKILKPDLKHRKAITLRRKYPIRDYVYSNAFKLLGGEFQAASKVDFSDARTIAILKEPSSEGQIISVPDTIGAYRYWRYINNNEGNHGSIAEIYFIGLDNKNISGSIIGSEALDDNSKNSIKNAFDGKLLTNFNSKASSGGWVGMDIGSPQILKSIIYYARGDGNAIEPGDQYELLYWDETTQWTSLGYKIAEGISVEYDNVPNNSLLLLRNRTKGNEEHVFVYENDEQKWW